MRRRRSTARRGTWRPLRRPPEDGCGHRGQRAGTAVFPGLSLHGYALGAVPGDVPVPAHDARPSELSRPGPDVLISYQRSPSRRSSPPTHDRESPGLKVLKDDRNHFTTEPAGPAVREEPLGGRTRS
ncbi:hypothetical protein GCM10009802_29460 [Streptomyces synnematoformans]|uniref:Uncharacterized protein n=1 Tax=Streptomyces synnematoformans TaxID=415721 RepID=A0ABN2YBG0_9ACTN